MLVSRAEIKETLQVGDKTVAKYLKDFRMQRIANVCCYDIDRNFLISLRQVILGLIKNYPGLNNEVHQNALNILENILQEWEETDEFAINSEDIRNLFSINLFLCEKLLSGNINTYLIKRLPKTYKVSKEFLDKLSARAKALDIEADVPLKQLYRLITPNTDISHRINHWTTDMLMCKERGCNCEGCFYENFFTPYDSRFGLTHQSPKTCNIKGYVKYAVDTGIPESKRNSDDTEDYYDEDI